MKRVVLALFAAALFVGCPSPNSQSPENQNRTSKEPTLQDTDRNAPAPIRRQEGSSSR